MPRLRSDMQFGEPSGAPGHAGCRRATGPLDYVRQMASTGMFFFLGIVSSPVCWILWKSAGHRISAISGQKFNRWLFRLYLRWMRATGTLRLDAQGMEALSEMSGTIVISNHPALLDVLLLTSLLPPTACVMRANLLKNPAMSGCALLAGYVTNDSGPALVRQGIEKIRAGQNLLIFPEGTRTVSGAVNAFKEGFALIASRTGAPVQTILIEHPGRHLTKGVSLFSSAELPLRFTIRPGERFLPESGESAREFSLRLEAWFHCRLQNSDKGILFTPSLLPL